MGLVAARGPRETYGVLVVFCSLLCEALRVCSKFVRIHCSACIHTICTFLWKYVIFCKNRELKNTVYVIQT